MTKIAPASSTASVPPEQVSAAPAKPVGEPAATTILFAFALAVIPVVISLAVLASLYSQLDIEAALRSGFGKWAQLN